MRPLSWTHVARLETLRLRRDPVAWIALAALVGFMLIAALGGRAEAERQRDTAAALTEQQAEQLNARAAMAADEEARIAAGEDVAASPWGARSAWGMGRAQGTRLVIPPAPLAGLAVGQSDLAPAAHHVSTAPAATQVPEARPASPFRLLVGGIDAAFVVLYVLPLLLLVLTFDLLSSDRERGTLRLLLAGPLSAGALAGGRAAVRGGALLLAAALLLVLTLAATGGDAARFGLFLAVVLAYGAFWVVLAVLVNVFGRTSASNAAVLAGAWLLLVVLLPALVHTAAGALYPPPERAAYVAAQRLAAAEAQRDSRAALAVFFEAHPELADAPEAGEPTFPMTASARDQAVAAALAPVEAADLRQRERRTAIARVARLVSPTLLAHDALLESAGTGLGRRTHVEAQVAAFRHAWTEHFVPRYFADNAFRAADYAAVPTFSFREEAAGSAASRVVLPLGALLLITLTAGAFSAYRLRTAMSL